ncbi:hypothetical protein IAT40_005227 [Kwoniella sp. CBS 6097]
MQPGPPSHWNSATQQGSDAYTANYDSNWGTQTGTPTPGQVHFPNHHSTPAPGFHPTASSFQPTGGQAPSSVPESSFNGPLRMRDIVPFYIQSDPGSPDDPEAVERVLTGETPYWDAHDSDQPSDKVVDYKEKAALETERLIRSQGLVDKPDDRYSS